MSDDRPVLLCFDGSADAGRAIGAAAALLGVRPAVVLTVWEPMRDLTPLNPIGDAVGRLSGLYADMDEAGLELARETAAAGTELAAGHGFAARPWVRCGAAAATIERVADELDAIAVVLGARGRAATTTMLGSVSARVCRHARHPVLVVPPAG